MQDVGWTRLEMTRITIHIALSSQISKDICVVYCDWLQHCKQSPTTSPELCETCCKWNNLLGFFFQI